MSRKYMRTTRLIVLGFAVLVGLVLGRFIGQFSGWVVVLTCVWAMLTWRRANIINLYLIIIFGLALGSWRGAIFMDKVNFANSLDNQKVTILGTALTESVYGRNGALEFDIGDLSTVSRDNRQIVGKIGVSGHGEKMIYRGDKIRITGKISKGRGSYTAWMSYAELEVLGRSESLVYTATREFSAGLQNALPEPAASFGLGLLVGQRDTLPESVSDTLKMVGLTHIIAVSGYNLTVLVRFTRRLFARRSKFMAAFFAVVLIFSFLLVTGSQPSIVRAAIISILSLAAWYYGRHLKPMVLISLVAAATALWHPLYVWSDIGWYLSFLAFFGVLILAPNVSRRYLGKTQGAFTQLILESMSAQIMTLPIILFVFGESSHAVLLANLLVVPFIPFAMVFAFLSGIAGIFMPALSGLIALPAKYLLTYMLDVASLVSRIPNIHYHSEISAHVMVFFYCLVVMICWMLWRKNQKSGKITDINDTNLVR